jgi:hypothetical protein
MHRHHDLPLAALLMLMTIEATAFLRQPFLKVATERTPLILLSSRDIPKVQVSEPLPRPLAMLSEI